MTIEPTCHRTITHKHIMNYTISHRAASLSPSLTLAIDAMAKLVGATPVIIETNDQTEFKVTPDQLRAERRRGRAHRAAGPFAEMAG
jgi:hypothetical protein